MRRYSLEPDDYAVVLSSDGVLQADIGEDVLLLENVDVELQGNIEATVVMAKGSRLRMAGNLTGNIVSFGSEVDIDGKHIGLVLLRAGSITYRVGETALTRDATPR